MIKQIIAFGIGLALISGCGIKIPQYPESKVLYKPKDTKEERLVASFLEYWHARITGDMQKAFSYELPYQKYIDGWKEYSQKVTPINKRSKIILKEISYPQENVAIVTKVVKIKDRTLIQKDKWIFMDGKWYHKYHQNVFPFPF